MTFFHHHSNQSKACEQQKSSLKEGKKKQKKNSWAAIAYVLRCCRGVMACCAQKDFYEASQLHLFRPASIKLAEALAARADRPRKPETRQNEQSWRDKQQKNCRKKKETGRKKKQKPMCCLDRRASARLRVVYLRAVRLLISAN